AERGCREANDAGERQAFGAESDGGGAVGGSSALVRRGVPAGVWADHPESGAGQTEPRVQAAGWCGGGDFAVEFSAGAFGAEGCTGAGGGVSDHSEAREPDAAVQSRVRGVLRGGQAAEGRVPGGDGERRDDRGRVVEQSDLPEDHV